MSSDDASTHALPTPFARPSWEPRFALDGREPSAPLLATALRLHVGCQPHARSWREDDAAFQGFRVRVDRIAVAAAFSGFPGSLSDATPWFTASTLEAAAAAVAGWLTSEAVYPTQPWFDGGEARGFQAWHVAYGQPGPYGYLLVEPKWFELHK